jgi:hypothetical protein
MLKCLPFHWFLSQYMTCNFQRLLLTPLSFEGVIESEATIRNARANAVTHLFEYLDTRFTLRPACSTYPELILEDLVKGVALAFDCLEGLVSVSVPALTRQRVWTYADIIFG